MAIRNSEGNPSIPGEGRNTRCPHELILMQLVLNGALRILEDAEPELSEALRRAECGRLQSVLGAIQEALYWANNKVEERCSPRRDDAPRPAGRPSGPHPHPVNHSALRGNLLLRRRGVFSVRFKKCSFFAP